MSKSGFILLTLGCLVLSSCGGGGDGAGTYELDKDAFKSSMLESALEEAAEEMEGATEEQKKVILGLAEKQVEALADAMDFKVVLNDDGTFVVNGAKGPGDKFEAKGTWKQDGETIEFTTTEEDGEKKEKPETVKGTCKDGVIRLRPDAEMPFDLVFKKK